MDILVTLTTVFLGIFIEAAPYLLLGTLASGVVEVFFEQEEMVRWFPRHPWLMALSGGLMGLFFPVCECGVVPLTRRLLNKGLPTVTGIAFLLAAPVINPIVIASTYAAFGFTPVFWGRLGLTLFIAVMTGLVLSVQPVEYILKNQAPVTVENENVRLSPITLSQKLAHVLVIAGDEFVEMGKFLVIGALLAAAMQTLLPQSALLKLGQGSVLSVLVMQGLALLLSVCSTVDAFIALAFTSTFSNSSILAFLVFGPMVDVKSLVMFSRVFKPRPVIYLALLPFLLIAVATSLVNLLTGW